MMSPRRILRNVLADRPSPVATPDVFVRNEARFQQQKREEDYLYLYLCVVVQRKMCLYLRMRSVHFDRVSTCVEA